MKPFPPTSSIMNLDARFTVEPEFCGALPEERGIFTDGKPMPIGAAWVARFCGQWISSWDTKDKAIEAAHAFNIKRMAEFIETN